MAEPLPPATQPAETLRRIRQALADVVDAAKLGPVDESKVDIQVGTPALRTPFRIDDIATASFAAVGIASDKLWRLQGNAAQTVTVATRAAGLSMRSNRYLKINGAVVTPDFKDRETGIYPARDGRFIYLHCNFPNIRDGNLAALGLKTGQPGLAEAIAKRDAFELEEQMFAHGGCGSVVRSPEEWAQHPQSRAVRSLPLLEIEQIGDAPVEPLPGGDRPLAGIRALDLTRVIAGPSCARMFAEHGADVLKVSRKDLPGSGMLDIDTGIGKEAAYLDLRDDDGNERMRGLVRGTDIFCQAYRPGALASKGFGYDALARLRPGIVCVSLSAWGHQGPWAQRRGYDTVVQCASGIAWTQGQCPGGTPAFYPVSAIDYVAGCLMAIGTMEALARRATRGGSWLVKVSLARAGQWITDAGLRPGDAWTAIPAELPQDEISPLLREIAGPMGDVRYLGPVLQMSATPPRLVKPPVGLGASPARWSSERPGRAATGTASNAASG